MRAFRSGPVVFSFLLLSSSVGAVSSTAKPCAPASEGASGVATADEFAQLSDEQVVRKLLEVTRAADVGKRTFDEMLESFRKLKNVPDGFIERFKKNVRVEELTDLIAAIYLKHYDRQTVLAAIRFHQSEHGAKMIAKQPQVVAESADAGRAWGKALVEKTFKDLGITLPEPE